MAYSDNMFNLQIFGILRNSIHTLYKDHSQFRATSWIRKIETDNGLKMADTIYQRLMEMAEDW